MRTFRPKTISLLLGLLLVVMSVAGYRQFQLMPFDQNSLQVNQGGKINLLTADEFTLMMLPGIGSALAARIVDYRNTHHLESIDDLIKVKGIGPTIVERIKPRLILKPDNDLNKY